MKKDTFKRAMMLLSPQERRMFFFALIPIVISALSSALTIASLMPFLSVLTNRNKLHDGGLIARGYEWSGFDREYEFIILLGVIAIVIILFSNGMNIARMYTVQSLTNRISYNLSFRLFQIYLGQPYAFFLKNHSGSMTTKVLSECEQFVTHILRPLADVTASLLTIVAISFVLVLLDPIIAISAFLFLGSIYALTFGFSRAAVHKLGVIRVDSNTERFRLVGEAFNGIKDVKILGREASYLARYSFPALRIAQGRKKANVIAELPKYVVETATLSGIIVVSIIALRPQPGGDEVDPGSLVALLGIFAFAAQRLIPELQRTYSAISKIQYGAPIVMQIYEDLQMKVAAAEQAAEISVPLGLKTKLCVENVAYCYDGSDRVSLSNLNFCVQAGERIGVVGGSGAGKTTLADLILGLLQPVSGQLVVDGSILNSENIRRWQQTVGYVPQDIFLTDASVLENIAFGVDLSKIDHNKVRSVADIANLTGLIENELSEGLATKLGERGARLSGGQRQRIGIARALYHDADLIIFDEATSALDNVTEAEVVQAIEQLPGTKTILVIAHRLSTVRNCDRIMVLSHGKVSGFDPWEKLLKNNIVFQELVQNLKKPDSSHYDEQL